MAFIEIVKRLFLAVVISGVIGFDREFKNRPAGMRTHILVCVGATVIALIQVQIGTDALEIARQNPNLAQVIRSDQARLIAQVVSGIGFLGAGTIVVTKSSVRGLTTAASIWAVACLGLAIGMGYYQIAIFGFIIIISTLTLLKKVIDIPSMKKLEITYTEREETKEFIQDYFDEKHVSVKGVDFNVDVSKNQRIYTNFYTIELPRGMNYSEIIEALALNEHVIKIRLINM